MDVLEQGRPQLDDIQVGLLQGEGCQSATDVTACSCHVGPQVGRPVPCGQQSRGLSARAPGYVFLFVV